jgi:Tol biopolymer transport system component
MRGIGLPGTTLVLGAILGALLLSLAATGPAGAAFPGGNGKIAFTSNRDGNFEIYTLNADGSSQTRLTNTPGLSAGLDTSPAFSPDGSRIVFESTRPSSNPADPSTDREIYVMNADGTNQTPFTANAYSDAEPSHPTGRR